MASEISLTALRKRARELKPHLRKLGESEGKGEADKQEQKMLNDVRPRVKAALMHMEKSPNGKEPDSTPEATSSPRNKGTTESEAVALPRMEGKPGSRSVLSYPVWLRNQNQHIREC